MLTTTNEDQIQNFPLILFQRAVAKCGDYERYSTRNDFCDDDNAV